MANLLRKPVGTNGKVHDITPESANWGYVGFGLYRLKAGESATEATKDTEVILVLVEGKAKISASTSDSKSDFGELGERMNVFERLPPHCVYIPAQSNWQALATTDCTLAICTAPAKAGRPAQVIGPDTIQLEQRGQGANTRFIHNIAMEGRDVADSLLVTEVFTPQGNWSSYPPHRHDEDNYPDMTYLEETYYHRLNPSQGFGIQRVFTEDGSLDETMAVADGDVVLVPKGHHPCGAPYGYEMYYLNVMAGPLRKWRFKNHPAHDWIYQRDSKKI
ncbi:5-deoxy-glucuronate isomerase [Paenochrobactrum sp. BZR 588]|uniref:5-deoxy-glucuronate isomerase n=1 Tax=Paenochrobactrum TaxID=999488 RepID=UPI0035BBF7E1